jgi:hypothetical protein
MSWIPTLRIAQAAWRGRTDPAGLIKTQLRNELSPQAPEAVATRQSVLPPVAATAAVAERTVVPARTGVQVASHNEQAATHNQLLLLLR